MIDQSAIPHLLSLPFLGLAPEVDALLLSLCHKTLNLASGPPYHQILYAFRIQRNDYRGAASILHDRLQRLKSSSSQVHDPADESLAQCYLMIINTLENVGRDDAYILAERRLDSVSVQGASGFGIGKGKLLRKREVVTLEMLRKEYQAELDRVEAVQKGEYPLLEVGDEMDIL
jgi:DNA repair protein RAD51/nuclear pore complex protein Nup160